MQNRKIIIMDEATSNLDKNSEDKIFKILNDIKSKKIIFKYIP